MGPFTIILTALMVGSQVAAYDQQKRAQRRQERAQRLEQRRQEIAAARERRQQLAQARRAQAQARAEAAGMGITGGSAVPGALASIETQARSSIGFSTGQEAANREIGFTLAAAQRSADRAGVAQAIGNLPNQLGFSPARSFGEQTGNPAEGG